MIATKSRDQVACMRRAGEIVGKTLGKLAAAAQPGVTTRELDRLADAEIRKAGMKPAFLGYRGYTATLCASVNEMVVHGVPGDTKLAAGDIVGLDLGAVDEGYYADAALTVAVGKVSPAAERLMRVSREALMLAIPLARPGQKVGDLSSTIQAHVEKSGYSVVRDFVGHGIGRALHEDPQIPNWGKAHSGPKLKAGMTICIEPMVNAGKPEVEILADGWTVVSKDRSLSAHYEHTLLITDGGPEILTPWDR
jgi:methionyl aminopeptidase